MCPESHVNHAGDAGHEQRDAAPGGRAGAKAAGLRVRPKGRQVLRAGRCLLQPGRSSAGVICRLGCCSAGARSARTGLRLGARAAGRAAPRCPVVPRPALSAGSSWMRGSPGAAPSELPLTGRAANRAAALAALSVRAVRVHGPHPVLAGARILAAWRPPRGPGRVVRRGACGPAVTPALPGPSSAACMRSMTDSGSTIGPAGPVPCVSPRTRWGRGGGLLSSAIWPTPSGSHTTA